MSRPQGPERRRVTRGRRDSDGHLERDIDDLAAAFARLERLVGPIAGQVADVDGALQAVQASLRSLERWLEDERTARRHHDAELDDSVDNLRAHMGDVDRNLRTLIGERFDACMSAIHGLGADTRAGRRTILITILTTTGVIIAAYLQGK